jgi:polyisoprenoid-binding protein YceI
MGNKHYVLDARASQFTVQAFAEGLAGIADHRPKFSIRDFSGDLEFDHEKLAGRLHLAARAGSLEVMDEVTEQDRKAIERVMFGEVLQPEEFPEIVFRSSKVVCTLAGDKRYRVSIEGLLSLHGEENPQTMEVQLVRSDDSLRIYGDCRLRQTDYGLAIASVAGGMLRIKDELKFVFFFVARAKNAS